MIKEAQESAMNRKKRPNQAHTQSKRLSKLKGSSKQIKQRSTVPSKYPKPSKDASKTFRLRDIYKSIEAERSYNQSMKSPKYTKKNQLMESRAATTANSNNFKSLRNNTTAGLKKRRNPRKAIMNSNHIIFKSAEYKNGYPSRKVNLSDIMSFSKIKKKSRHKKYDSQIAVKVKEAKVGGKKDHLVIQVDDCRSQKRPSLYEKRFPQSGKAKLYSQNQDLRGFKSLRKNRNTQEKLKDASRIGSLKKSKSNFFSNLESDILSLAKINCSKKHHSIIKKYKASKKKAAQEKKKKVAIVKKTGILGQKPQQSLDNRQQSLENRLLSQDNRQQSQDFRQKDTKSSLTSIKNNHNDSIRRPSQRRKGVVGDANNPQQNVSSPNPGPFHSSSFKDVSKRLKSFQDSNGLGMRMGSMHVRNAHDSSLRQASNELQGAISGKCPKFNYFGWLSEKKLNGRHLIEAEGAEEMVKQYFDEKMTDNGKNSAKNDIVDELDLFAEKQQQKLAKLTPKYLDDTNSPLKANELRESDLDGVMFEPTQKDQSCYLEHSDDERGGIFDTENEAGGPNESSVKTQTKGHKDNYLLTRTFNTMLKKKSTVQEEVSSLNKDTSLNVKARQKLAAGDELLEGMVMCLGGEKGMRKGKKRKGSGGGTGRSERVGGTLRSHQQLMKGSRLREEEANVEELFEYGKFFQI